jgi:hypothetical protein
MSEHATEKDVTPQCYGCFWDMRPGPWHTCGIPPGSPALGPEDTGSESGSR